MSHPDSPINLNDSKSRDRLEDEEGLVLWSIAKLFTLTEVAEMLEMCPTVFKKKCRNHGIRRWPFRSFQQLFGLLRSSHLTVDDRLFLEHLLATSENHRFELAEDDKIRLGRLAQFGYKMKNKEKL